MDYRKFGETYYVRMDRGDEIIATLLDICRKEGIASAVYSGIGGCKNVEMQIFVPEKCGFETELIEGVLELVSINGNVVTDEEGTLYHHTHAHYTYFEDGKHCSAAGHIKSTTVLYTAEIELRPVICGTIGRTYDPETGTGFWKLHD